MNRKNIFLGIIVVLGLATTSCDNFFNADSDEILLEKDSFKKRSELYSAFIGNAALFQDAAEHTLYMSELRADLMEPTENAPVDFWNVYRYKADVNNTLVQADVYYKVILECNDFLRHAFRFHEQQPGVVEDNIFKGMISETIRFRAYCYLTLGKLYGEATWHDLSIQDAVDLDKAEVLKFDALLERLAGHLKTGVNGISGTIVLDWNLITYTEDKGWNRVGINPGALLGEIYLWQGQYKMALDQLLTVVNKSGDEKTFTVNQFTDNNVAKWRNMFTESITNSAFEIISGAPYDATRQQVNKLQYYFSPVLPNVYYLRPSSTMLNLFETQTTSTGKLGDLRGKDYTYATFDNKLIIKKYSYNKKAEEQDATVIVYRGGDIHLMISECLNRLHLFQEALAFVNDGAKAFWNSGGFFNKPFNNPMFSANLKENAGIRGRVKMKAVNPIVENMTDEQIEFAIDSVIRNEVALECAYEGKRYFTLMRSAQRWQQPEIMAKTLALKFPVEEREAYISLLMNPENWYIKQKSSGK